MAMVDELDADFRERDIVINVEGTDDMYGLDEHVSTLLSRAYNYDIIIIYPSATPRRNHSSRQYMGAYLPHRCGLLPQHYKRTSP